MKKGLVFAIIAAVVVALLAWFFVDVDVDGGALPEVSVEGGALPEAEVTTGDINVGTEEQTVTVPTLEVEPAPEADTDDAAQ